MDITTINPAIEMAYADALANGGRRVKPQTIAPNVTIQTDSYSSMSGSGFRVVCIIKQDSRALIIRVRNHGPDINSEREWPPEGIETALQNMPPPFYKP